jgi:drug/metabolite transporter (DMT)-like permease
MGGLEFAAVITIFLVALLIGLIPMVFYLITLQNTLSEIGEQNRKMPPGQVWLILIPLFGIIWNFFVVNAIADGLKAEFDQRGVTRDENRPGAGIGIAMAILQCCSVIPVLGSLAAIAGLVCWIIYWVKISGYKTQLVAAKMRTH